jgi:hypothetical protein
MPFLPHLRVMRRHVPLGSCRRMVAAPAPESVRCVARAAFDRGLGWRDHTVLERRMHESRRRLDARTADTQDGATRPDR